MVKIVFCIMIAIPIVAYSESEYQQFLQDINTAQEKIDYSESLIRYDELHTLILVKPKEIYTGAKEQPENSQGATKGTKTKDEDAGNGKQSDSAQKQIKGAKINDVDSGEKDGSSQGQVKGTRTKGDGAQGQVKGAKTKGSGAGGAGGAGEQSEGDQKQIKGRRNVNSVYISPALRNISESAGTSDSVSNSADFKYPESRRIVYGITIGTHIEVQLDTSATNIQPGFIQFVTTKDIVGYKKTMPRKTRIFGRPSAVLGSAKLFVNVSNGIEPIDNSEFTVQGLIFDDEGKPGLVASVISDGLTLDRSVDAGAAALGTGVLNLVPGSLGTDAAKAAASQLLNEKRSANQAENGSPRYILEAAPQKAVIQIERTF